MTVAGWLRRGCPPLERWSLLVALAVSTQWASTEHQAHQPVLVFTTVSNYLLVKSELHAS